MNRSDLFNTTLSTEMRLSAPPETVFPLLCPVREEEWIPGWKATVLHSRSGRAELGCVFTTRDEDGRERVWTITRHDAGSGTLQLVQFLAGLCVVRLDISLRAEAGGTRATWTYAVAALAPSPAGHLAAYAESPFRARMARLERLLEAFLTSGRPAPPLVAGD